MDPVADPGAASGRVLAGRFLLVAPLAVGATATVWRALDQRLGREVAVKILGSDPRDRGAASPERFEAEARAAATLDHPGIVAVYDVLRDGPTTAIVMALVAGESLASRLRREGPVGERAALIIGAQIADALAHAHSRGVLHCDVKPGNILLGHDGRARLTDFGIARARSMPTSRMPATLVEGSLSALPPERLLGAEPTPAADVFGLGEVLYELVTGRMPWPATTPADMFRAQQTAPPRPQGASNGLALLIARCLSRDPAARPAALEVATLLRALLQDPNAPPARRQDPDSATRRVPAAGPHPSRPGSKRRSRVAAAGGVGGLAAALALLGLITLPGFSFGPGPASSPSARPAAAAASPTRQPKPLATPTPRPTPSPSPTARPTPTPPIWPLVGLRILAPADGAVVAKDVVTLTGLARPGATITHDIPFWPDDHAKADDSGRWAMTVALDPGQNEIRLRVGDDRSTETVLRVVSAT